MRSTLHHFKLCRTSGGDLEQIQFLLGHSSVQTTEQYLGSEQNLKEAVNDKRQSDELCRREKGMPIFTNACGLRYPDTMESALGRGTTSPEQLAAQLEHPSALAIRSRAREVFGDDQLARSWMQTPRDIFGGRSPEELVESGNADQQRRVLQILLRIDYGVFS